MKRVLFGMLNPSKAGAPPDGDLTVTKVCGFAAQLVGASPGLLEVTDGGAVFSHDRLYRYRLWRELGPGGSPRVRVDVVNLSAWISTDPDALHGVADPFGPENMQHVDAALAEAELVIAAWGSLAGVPAWLRYQGETVLRAFTRLHDVQCLGKTRDGSPRHPSRLAYATPLELFRPRRAA